MPAGLTVGEELDLALAENKRYRAAMAIALRALDAARERGLPQASEVIGDINEALAAPLTPSPRRAKAPGRLAGLRRRLWG